MALGGQEPPWLRPVEALICVHHYFPGDQEVLFAAAEAIGAKNVRRSQIARESDSAPILIALAAFGQKQVATNPLLDENTWTLLRFHRDPEVSRQALELAHVLPRGWQTSPTLRRGYVSQIIRTAHLERS